jgi:hypothetical protein
MKVNVSQAAWKRAFDSLDDPSKSQFYAAYNIKNIYSHVYEGFTFEFTSDADATFFLLRFS